MVYSVRRRFVLSFKNSFGILVYIRILVESFL